MALFCTYDNKIGTTLTDLEEALVGRGIEVIGKLSLGMLKPGRFLELDETDKDEYLNRINGFIELCKGKLVKNLRVKIIARREHDR